MYVDDADGWQICTEHDERFKAPLQCQRCSPSRAISKLTGAEALAPEVEAAITGEIETFVALAVEFRDMAAAAATDTGQVGFSRLRFASIKVASELRIQRADWRRIARLAERKSAAAVMRDVRDEWQPPAGDN